MFLQDAGHVVQTKPDVMPPEAVEEGVWIKADPIPGCIVCNIGESQYPILVLSLCELAQRLPL